MSAFEKPYRDNSPDGLFGAVMALEAALSVILEDRLAGLPPPEALSVALALRRRAEEAFLAERRVTKYGTGAVIIEDAGRETLEAIFGAVCTTAR